MSEREMGRHELLRLWLETGRDQRAVAVRGMSVEALRATLNTGIIPSSYAQLDYQQQFTEGGKYFYYLLPFYDKLQREAPELLRTIEESLGGFGLGIRRELSRKEQRSRSVYYAREAALADCFYDKTGKRVDGPDVITLGCDLLPEEINSFCERTGYWYGHPLELHNFPEALLEIKTRVQGEMGWDEVTLKRIISECIKRRGVLIYFGEEIFSHRLEAGKEDEVEVLLVTDRPLTAAVISGIEVLSRADRKVLGI